MTDPAVHPLLHESLSDLMALASARRNDAHGRDGRRANPWLARRATRPLIRHLRELTGLAIPIGLAEE